MISLFYTFTLCLLSFYAFPKRLLDRIRKGKYKKRFFSRFPQKIAHKVYWIHAVSLGETKAAIPFIHKLKKEKPNIHLIFSTMTETGYQEALKIKELDTVFFLPFDFPWNISRLLRRISPSVFILIETDFWYHLLRKLKKKGVKCVLINGKITEKSEQRFKKVPFFTKKLFSYFDVLCVQSDLYKSRFIHLGIPEDKLHVCGNLKFDQMPVLLQSEEKKSLCKQFGIDTSHFVIALASTHKNEEFLLLQEMKPLLLEYPQIKVLIIPRHPERFAELKKLELENSTQIVLVDQMGILSSLYQISSLAIVCGSFVDHVGGHNIFEPLFFGIPSLFGPHMHKQTDLVKRVLNAEAGMQISLSDLPAVIEKLLKDVEFYQTMSTSAKTLADESKGTTEKIFEILVRQKIC